MLYPIESTSQKASMIHFHTIFLDFKPTGNRSNAENMVLLYTLHVYGLDKKLSPIFFLVLMRRTFDIFLAAATFLMALDLLKEF